VVSEHPTIVPQPARNSSLFWLAAPLNNANSLARSLEYWYSLDDHEQMAENERRKQTAASILPLPFDVSTNNVASLKIGSEHPTIVPQPARNSSLFWLAAPLNNANSLARSLEYWYSLDDHEQIAASILPLPFDVSTNNDTTPAKVASLKIGCCFPHATAGTSAGH
jgi:predicted phosphoadenosine phosphosulfate sulfurtransferase